MKGRRGRISASRPAIPPGVHRQFLGLGKTTHREPVKKCPLKFGPFSAGQERRTVRDGSAVVTQHFFETEREEGHFPCSAPEGRCDFAGE